MSVLLMHGYKWLGQENSKRDINNEAIVNTTGLRSSIRFTFQPETRFLWISIKVRRTGGICSENRGT